MTEISNSQKPENGVPCGSDLSWSQVSSSLRPQSTLENYLSAYARALGHTEASAKIIALGTIASSSELLTLDLQDRAAIRAVGSLFLKSHGHDPFVRMNDYDYSAGKAIIALLANPEAPEQATKALVAAVPWRKEVVSGHDGSEKVVNHVEYHFERILKELA